MNQKSRWETEYESIKNGSIDNKIKKLGDVKKQLIDKIVEAYKASKSDKVSALQGQIQRVDQEVKKHDDSKKAVKVNEQKIQNILQLKKDLVKESSELLGKVSNVKEYTDAKKQVDANDKKLTVIEAEIATIDSQIKMLNKTINDPNTQEADRKKAEQDKAKLNTQRQQKSNEMGKLNTEEYAKSRAKMQELENQVGTYDLKTIKSTLAKNEKLIAKCDLIGTNLVNGKSMEEITANLKNFKFKHDKNFSQKISTMRDLYKTEEKEKVEKTKKNNENATEEAKKAYEKARKAVETAEKARNEYEKISNLPATKTPWYKKIPILKQIFNRKQTQNLEKTKKLAEETENAAKKAIEEYRTKKDEMEKTKKVAKDTEMERSTEYLEELRGQKNEDEVLKGMAVYGETFRDKLKYKVPTAKSGVTQQEADNARSKDPNEYVKKPTKFGDKEYNDHTTDKRADKLNERKAQVKANREQIRKMKEKQSGQER